MEHLAPSQITVTHEDAPPPFESVERRRSSVLEFLVEPEVAEHDYAAHPPEEEELPHYEAEGIGLPVYEERHLLAPVISYNFYQINRKLQIITPATLATIDRPRYRASCRTAPSVFSKKADLTLTRLPSGAQAAAESCSGKDIATTNFDRNGQLPWMPRATVVYNASTKKSYPMSAPNFSDWRISIDGQSFSWRLADKPTSLILVEHSSNTIVARFTYSRDGTDATRGAEVGQLDIYGGSRSEEQEMVELVLSTVQVAIQHWKSMGRHYRNNITPRTCSVTTMGNSFFAHDGSQRRRASYFI